MASTTDLDPSKDMGCYYTQSTGIISLRATAVRVSHHNPRMGIVSLRLTDGSTTYPCRGWR